MSRDLTPLDAAIELTAQRDLDSLAAALVRVIGKLQGGGRVTVHALQGDLGQLSAKLLAGDDGSTPGSHLTALENRPLLSRCIDSQAAVVETARDGRQHRTYPVMDQGQVAGLVCCESAGLDEAVHQTIARLVQLYANQRSLLNHQQRDGLTGLFNRAALDSWLAKALAPDGSPGRRAIDASGIGCFALFDIDHFKCINDTLGHLYGDEVLLILAELMRDSFRFNDLLFRYGGEEFVAVLTDTELETALGVLDRFRARVAAHPFPQINQVTLTIGVTEIEARTLPSSLIERADKALYHGKRNGRDQVNAWEWLETGPPQREAAGDSATIELF